MSWTTPKTDWSGETVGGKYTGDYFNAGDFNRIKNNLIYLHDLAQKLYDSFAIEAVSEDKAVGDFFYADEINAMEQNLATINNSTINRSYGEAQTYEANGCTPDYAELNRLESASLDLYGKLTNQYNSRRMFKWNFGIQGGL